MSGFSEVNAIIYKDYFFIRKYPLDHFDAILDIGANLGTFSLTACILNVEARVFAFEPYGPNIKCLRENLKKFKSIETHQIALGNGLPLGFKDQHHHTAHTFIENFEGDNKISASSMTLRDMGKTFEIDPMSQEVFLKMDCEGGERFLIGDTDSEDFMRNCSHIAMEIHFPNPKNHQFDSFPSWEIYDRWINNIFKDSHDVLYYRSSKKRGVGHYVIVKKGNFDYDWRKTLK